MSVLIETTEGELVIDLDVNDAPKSCTNFLKLCKAKYYNFAPFFNVNPNFTVQCGDPNYPKGDGGESIWRGTFKADKSKDEIKRGDVAMALADGTQAGSQFVIALGDIGESLKSKVAVFGAIVEGFDTLDKINKAYCDDDKRPLKDIRIKHAYILEDPFDDPPGVVEVPSPEQPSELQRSTIRLGEDDLEEEELDEEEKEKRRLQQQSRSQALTLEIMGDLPHAEVRPPENVLFVCKLNPVTNDEDLELIFSRFGSIISCEIVRNPETKESKQYAFIEFENREDCEMAYYKMEGVLIDDRRIHVDYSQSVSRLSDSWRTMQNSKRRAAHGSKFVQSSQSSRAAPPSSSSSRTGQRYSSHRSRDDQPRDREREKDRDRDRYKSSRSSRDDRHSSHRHRHRSDRDRSRERDRRRRDDRDDDDRRRRDKDRNRDRERDSHRHRSSSPRRR